MKKKPVEMPLLFDAGDKVSTHDATIQHEQTANDILPSVAAEIMNRFGVSRSDLAKYLGTSPVSVVRWAQGDTTPSPQMQAKLVDALRRFERGEILDIEHAVSTHVFASRGVRRRSAVLPLFQQTSQVDRAAQPRAPIISRLSDGNLWGGGVETLSAILAAHDEAALTIAIPAADGISAGKNTYTYDAHTYHTKVPPQGIAEVVRRYLPEGGVVLDPFAGSGMTGVAARALGNDVILNELSPAASFIADRFSAYPNNPAAR